MQRSTGRRLRTARKQSMAWHTINSLFERVAGRLRPQYDSAVGGTGLFVVQPRRPFAAG